MTVFWCESWVTSASCLHLEILFSCAKLAWRRLFISYRQQIAPGFFSYTFVHKSNSIRNPKALTHYPSVHNPNIFLQRIRALKIRTLCPRYKFKVVQYCLSLLPIPIVQLSRRPSWLIHILYILTVLLDLKWFTTGNTLNATLYVVGYAHKMYVYRSRIDYYIGLCDIQCTFWFFWLDHESRPLPPIPPLCPKLTFIRPGC